MKFYPPSFDRWGRYPLFIVKIGTMSGSVAAIRGGYRRGFCVGDIIDYAPEDELRDRSTSMAPNWHRGRVWKIDNYGHGRLFIEKL